MHQQSLLDKKGWGQLENGQQYIWGWPTSRKLPNLDSMESLTLVEAAKWCDKAFGVHPNNMDALDFHY